MVIAHLLFAIFWIVYCVLHSSLASESIKAVFQKQLGNYFKYYRLGYNVFALVSLIPIIWYGLSVETVHLFRQSLVTKITGGVISLTGLLLMLICIIKYFPGLSGLFNVQQQHQSNRLIIYGVHRFVRHPLYLGTFIFLWGLVIFFPTLILLISTAIITAYTLVAIPLEEQKLVKQFGEDYRTYQKTVPKIIPKIRIAENS